MLKIIYINILFILLVTACGKNERQEALNRINAIKKSDSLYLPENRGKLIDSLIREYETFMTHFPADSVVQTMLYEQASLQLAMGRYPGAIKILDRMHSQFPTGKLAPDALLLKGNIYHDKMNNITNAKKCWEELIEKYPESPLANDTRTLLQNIGLSPEELFRKIVSQNDSTASKK